MEAPMEATKEGHGRLKTDEHRDPSRDHLGEDDGYH